MTTTEESWCAICLDKLSSKKTCLIKECKHEFCFKCVEELVMHSEDQEPPYLIKCPICNLTYHVWSDITEIVHPVINLMHDPIDLTEEVIDLTSDNDDKN